MDKLYGLNGIKVPCKYWSKGKLVDYEPETPRIYPGQRELINKLTENGIVPEVGLADAEATGD